MKRGQFLYFLLSFLIVASAQPDWSPLACLLASSIGYALFWKGMTLEQRSKRGFFQALIWFGGVQSVHLSWFAADRYVGGVIYLFLALLALALGVQFALVSLLIDKERLSLSRVFGISGLWAILEWGRLYLLSGFSWNPVGLAFSGTLYGMQLASLFGLFGMSFLLFLTNLLALRLFQVFTPPRLALWGLTALAPYIFGWGHVRYHSKEMEAKGETLSTILVQASIYPEYKLPLNGSEPISPDMQWVRLLSLLFPYLEMNPDLILLSEAVVPYGANYPIYPIQTVQHTFTSFFPEGDALPPTEDAYVGNTYWARALANLFSADVIVGLEDYEFGESGRVERAYNAAFLASPNNVEIERYEKRVLVPMGEYIPFNWCRPLLAKYGIVDSFAPGSEAKVFSSTRVPLAASICYEETYGHLMRESRLKGAKLLVNLTNDVWYPRSRLPVVHFHHGRLRAVEMGIPLLRSCNTGVTCGVDSLGRTVAMLPYESARAYSPADALALDIPLYSYPTLYARFGDMPVVLFSLICFVFSCFRRVYKRKSFSIKDLEVSPLRKN